MTLLERPGRRQTDYTLIEFIDTRQLNSPNGHTPGLAERADQLEALSDPDAALLAIDGLHEVVESPDKPDDTTDDTQFKPHYNSVGDYVFALDSSGKELTWPGRPKHLPSVEEVARGHHNFPGLEDPVAKRRHLDSLL